MNDSYLALPDEVVAEVDPLVERCCFPNPGTAVRCGVSGGADSLALLVLARRAGLIVTAVHVDHGLRPGSAAEAETVSAAAEKTGALFASATVELVDGSDLEQRARIARHRVLGPEAMVAHTADDQAETVLINLMRGAGVDGLAGIAPGHRHPILALRRVDTERVCELMGLTPVVDPTNSDPRFVRNRVRRELLPLMADISGRDPVPLLARTAQTQRSVAEDLDRLAATVDPTDTRTLVQLAPTIAHRALREWLRDDLGHPPSLAEIERVMVVVRHEAVACELPGGRRVVRRDGLLRLEPGPKA